MDATQAPPVAPPPKSRPLWFNAWPIYLVLVVVMLLTVYVTRTRQRAGLADPLLPAAIQLEQNIEVKFTEVSMQGRQKGVPRWIIKAPTVSLSRDGRYTHFEPNPKGRFLNLKDWRSDEASPTTKVRSLDWTAKRAQYDSFSEDLEMDGNVVLHTDDKDVIKTEKLLYKARTKKVLMPQKVDIKMVDGTEARADALEANSEAEVFELKGNVDFWTTAQDEEKL